MMEDDNNNKKGGIVNICILLFAILNPLVGLMYQMMRDNLKDGAVVRDIIVILGTLGTVLVYLQVAY